MAKVSWLCVGEPDDRCGMKTLSNNKSFSQTLINTFAGEDRRTVVRRGSSSIAPVLNEIVLGFGRVGAATVFMC